MLAFFAILAQLVVCTIVFGVCLVCAVVFGFILVVHVTAWWSARPAPKEDIPFMGWRKRL